MKNSLVYLVFILMLPVFVAKGQLVPEQTPVLEHPGLMLLAGEEEEIRNLKKQISNGRNCIRPFFGI